MPLGTLSYYADWAGDYDDYVAKIGGYDAADYPVYKIYGEVEPGYVAGAGWWSVVYGDDDDACTSVAGAAVGVYSDAVASEPVVTTEAVGSF